MHGRDYSLDKKGLRFALAFISLCISLAGITYYDTLLSVAYIGQTRAPHIAVTDMSSVVPGQTAAAVGLASTTPQRIINKLTIADTVPKTGKFIAADLVNMKILLYQDSALVGEYPIKTKGRPGTPWETPSGFYNIQTKEENHFSSIGKVYMPYSMQFYGNYFIHGWTYYPDGTPTPMTFSGGCIKLETTDAEAVFAFAEVGTKVFVYDAKQEQLSTLSLILTTPFPEINAVSYLVADIDTGDVYAEQAAGETRPIASTTKLMTALVANEVISFDKKVSVVEGDLVTPPISDAITPKTFLVGDLFYPLLMQSSNVVADSLAAYYSKRSFVRWMNTTAEALGMHATTYADPSGVSADNVSTSEDLFKLAAYLSNKKSFVLKIVNTQEKVITSEDGSEYHIKNTNTATSSDAVISTLSFTYAGEKRRVAVIVLGSKTQAEDTKQLADWITVAAKNAATMSACASCAAPQYRRIEL